MLGVKRKDGAGLIAGNLSKVEAETLHEPAGLPLCHARRHLPSVIPDILNRESIRLCRPPPISSSFSFFVNVPLCNVEY